MNEARRGMRLRHPHIAGVHDFAVCADGTGSIVMEYVHGHNLRDLLATRGPLRLPLVGTIAVQTLDALGYLHSEKFIHRDISPDNLILTTTADGKPFVKLIDLGISKSLESGQTMTANDNLLVYYAGHGAVRNEKGYWQPVDADFDMTNWISPAMIRDVLLDHPARRTLILADSCYSGALARGIASTADAEARKEKRSRIVISSGGNAPVIDSADGQHSLFTRALLDVLGGNDADVADVQSLFTRIRERVTDSARRAGREQNPDLSVMAEVGDEGGTFFFVSH